MQAPCGDCLFFTLHHTPGSHLSAVGHGLFRSQIAFPPTFFHRVSVLSLVVEFILSPGCFLGYSDYCKCYLVVSMGPSDLRIILLTHSTAFLASTAAFLNTKFCHLIYAIRESKSWIIRIYTCTFY